MSSQQHALAALVLAAAVTAGAPTAPIQPMSPSGDYLRGELRSRVERLKLEATTPASDREVIGERLRTLVDWSNAYAVSGGVPPTDLPAVLIGHQRWQRQLDSADAPSKAQELAVGIARLVEELTLKDERPDAIGTLKLGTAGPFVAATAVVLEQIYSVGSQPLALGGAIVIGGRHLELQAHDPLGPGFTSVRSSSPVVSLELEANDGRFRGLHLDERALVFRVTGGDLQPGETVTVTYGDRQQGSPGLVLARYSNDRVVLPLYLDLDGRGTLLTPRWPSFAVVGEREVRRVNAVAPSILQIGERFTLRVRSEDAHRNLASGTAPAYQLRLNGHPFTNLPPGDPLTLLEGLQILEPGVHRFSLMSFDGKVEGRSNPIWVQVQPRQRLYWGDLHGHGDFGTGLGSPASYLRFGRDVAGLDFLAFSEPDVWLDDGEWQTLIRLAEEYLEAGRFTPILGYEWTGEDASSEHRIVYFRDTLGRQQAPRPAPADLGGLYRTLRHLHQVDDLLIVPHGHGGDKERRHEPTLERLVEITSGDGSFEPLGRRYLERGATLGFMGSSDNRVSHPGYAAGQYQLGGLTAVLAARNTQRTLFDALRARQVYATTGERIILDLTLNGQEIGSEVPATLERRLTGAVYGTAAIDRVEVIKNGTVVYSRPYLAHAIEADSWLQLKLESEYTTDDHRPMRPQRWRGHLEVGVAELARVQPPWSADREHFSAELDGDRRVSFDITTHGRGQALMILLRQASRATTVTLEIAARGEPAALTGTPGRRPTAPPLELSVGLDELVRGPFRHQLEDADRGDAVELQLIAGELALDQTISYVDYATPVVGDYYYLRVLQVDGSMAWSSPFWMGAPPAP